LNLQNVLSIGAGLVATAVYFYLFNKTVEISRRVPLGVAQVLLVFGYLFRLMAVGAVLLASVFLADLKTLPVGISFIVSFTGVFIYTQGRAIQHLMTGRLAERKE